MKTIKVLFVGTAMFLSTGIVLAGGKKAITNTAVTAKGDPSESKAKVKDGPFTYYVTGKSGDNYVLSSTQSEDCTGGSSPCRITSDEELGTTVPQSTVDNQDGVTINTRQPAL